MTKDEALDLALKALEKSLPRLAPYGEQDWLDSKAAITAIKQARSAPVQGQAAFNAGVPLLYPEMKDGETISVEYTTPPGGRQSEDCLTAAPVQEPVAFEDWHSANYVQTLEKYGDSYKNMHVRNRWQGWLGAKSTPPAAQRQWVGLTDEEIDKTPCELYAPDQGGMTVEEGLQVYARAIEAKLRSKNNG